jgi:hypothetical protein
MTGELREALIADIERGWDWLERWGHEPHRSQLSSAQIFDLMDLRDEVQHRIRVLAEGWDHWW